MQDIQANKSLQRITLIMVLLNAFTTPLMLSAVNVALPAIATDLSMNAVLLSWVPMAYLMASAMFVLIFRTYCRYGRTQTNISIGHGECHSYVLNRGLRS